MKDFLRSLFGLNVGSLLAFLLIAVISGDAKPQSLLLANVIFVPVAFIESKVE